MSRRLPTLLCTALFMTACGVGESDFAGESMESVAMEPPPPAAALASRSAEAMVLQDEGGAASPDVAQPPESRHLIRSGHLRIEVSSLDASLEAVQSMAESAGGYLARSSTRESGNGARSADLMLRIPAPEFDGVVAALANVGRVTAESVNVVDVSRDYVDIETHLAVREQTVERLRQLAREGGGLEDLLAIERELGRALEQLESLKGQLVYYDRRIAESDLEITLFEPGAVISDGAFQPLREAWREAAGVFARSLASILYVAVFLAPWVLLVGLAGWAVRVMWVRRRRRAAVE